MDPDLIRRFVSNSTASSQVFSTARLPFSAGWGDVAHHDRDTLIVSKAHFLRGGEDRNHDAVHEGIHAAGICLKLIHQAAVRLKLRDEVCFIARFQGEAAQSPAGRSRRMLHKKLRLISQRKAPGRLLRLMASYISLCAASRSVIACIPLLSDLSPQTLHHVQKPLSAEGFQDIILHSKAE